MEEIVRFNAREYQDLTPFQRPIIKRMFQSGTGLKVEDLISPAAEMTRCLEQAKGPHSLSLSQIQVYRRQMEIVWPLTSPARRKMPAAGSVTPQNWEIALQALQQRRDCALALSKVLGDIEQALQVGS